jgi:arginyl-tRNA synthetase
MKLILEAQIKDILMQAGYPCEVSLAHPNHPEHGHYASNVAFVLAKTHRVNPKELAVTLASVLQVYAPWEGRVGISPLNGFLNFTLSPAYLWELSFDQTMVFPEVPGRVLLEYVSANPTGPLHIGHGRWAVLGDVLARLLRRVGMCVDTEFYINDAGGQVRNLYASVAALKEGRPIPEEGYHGQYVHDIAASALDPLVYNLDEQRRTLDALGVTFSQWFSEKSLHDSAKTGHVMDLLRHKNVIFEQDGATWFRSTDFGDDKDRVLTKSDGQHTYFLMDLVYHFDKIQRGYDRLINIWGADHHGYIKRVKSGVAALCGESFLDDKVFKVLLGQLVNLFREGVPVRMSKRTGDMITLQEVMDEIGVDATRFFLVDRSPDTHVEFDLSLAKEQSSANPVYYIQYAHARLNGILVRLGDGGDWDVPVTCPTQLVDAELELLWTILSYRDCLWESARTLSVHQVAMFAYSLAKKVQSFYEKCPIMSESIEVQRYRRELVKLAKFTLADVLGVLGMSAPERM